MKFTSAQRWLEELVRLPSINPGGAGKVDPQLHGEKRVTDWLENWAKSKKIQYFRQKVLSDRDNLVMVVGPDDPHAKAQLWEVHQDTVDIAGMTVPPFEARVQDGKLFGRGACDVKGSMASMLAALERLHYERPQKAWKIVLACTVDEEHTFQGVQALRGNERGFIRVNDSHQLKPEFAVVAEPSQLGLITAHKGVIRWYIRVEGSACHSSTPHLGSNAIYGAAKIASRIAGLHSEIQQKSPDAISAGSISLTQISGGSAPNIVPSECTLLLDRRIGFQECTEEAENQLKTILAQIDLGEGLRCELSTPIIRCPALQTQGNEAAENHVSKAVRQILGNCTSTAVAFGTDASTLAEHGIPSVVFGPGNIRQAHTRDEWINLSEVESAAEILFQLGSG